MHGGRGGARTFTFVAGLCGVVALSLVAGARVGPPSPAGRALPLLPSPKPLVSAPRPTAPKVPRTVYPAKQRAAQIQRARHSAAAPSPLAGKGMWLYQFEQTAGGNPAEIARLAAASHLTHLYVRVGTGWSGLDSFTQATSLIVPAHAYGIKVIAWYFPYFRPITADLSNSLTTINYSIAGQGFDGFAADIEPTGGSRLTPANAEAYSVALRVAAPSAYLVAVPPWPSHLILARHFPYASIVPHYDAVAPMVYWGGNNLVTLVDRTMSYLSRFNVPVAPIGQAYDMGPEGGPHGNPGRWPTLKFVWRAKQSGAIGVSFWDWQEASSEQWGAIRDAGW